MTPDTRLHRVFPLMGRLPGTLPWRLAGFMGDTPLRQRRELHAWLAALFAGVFPDASSRECQQWARAHTALLAQEKVDAMAFSRLGRFGGPQADICGMELVRKHAAAGHGLILVLNHYDRPFAAPVFLARGGIKSHVLTMPVRNNAELSAAHCQFLLRKLQNYTSQTGGLWHTTDQSMRPLYESLRAGQVWVILADAWRPEFKRNRLFPFLGGQLFLPTGIERLARALRVPLLHVSTYSDKPHRLRVLVRELPADPAQAIDLVIHQLEHDVRQRPWAWLQWGLWHLMWQASDQVLNQQEQEQEQEIDKH